MPSSPPVSVTLAAVTIETATFADGLVAAWGPNNAFLVTTPNATFIPEIVEGIVSVHLRVDGTFGVLDPTQWPQVFTTRYPYLAALQKGPTTPTHPNAPMWSIPSQEQFVCLPNTPVRGFGHFGFQYFRSLDPLVREVSSKAREYAPQAPDSKADLGHLRFYEAAMMRAWERLLTICATYRDQLLQAATPITSWPLPVNRQLMGAWSCQPGEVQQLLALGIPVWLVRLPHVLTPNTRVGAFVTPNPPHSLCHARFHDSEPLYQGLAGERHLKVMFEAQTYRDVSLLPTADVVDPDDYCALPRDASDHQRLQGPLGDRLRGASTGSARRKRDERRPYSKSKAKPPPRPRTLFSSYTLSAQDRTALAHASQIRGRDKFLDFTHPWMPPALPSWDRAMRAVDRSAHAKPATEIWGYWIPEPALFLGPKDPVRAQRYLLSWVLTQPVWLYMLQVPGSGAVKVAPQAWRDFLNGIPDDPSSVTRTGQRAFEIKQVFARVFADRDLVPTDAQATVVGAEAGPGVREAEWQGGRLTEDAVNARIAPCIVWEVFELGFRYELLALDRVLRPMFASADIVEREGEIARVFPAGSLWAVSRLPDEDSRGLFALLPHHRVSALNALRKILTLWMRCPPEIREAEPLQLADSVERIEEMELWLASFYTQTFFDVSGRAPIVPHRWPGLSSKSQSRQEGST